MVAHMLLVYTAAAKQVQVMTLIAKTDERKLPLKPIWLAYVRARLSTCMDRF